MKQTSSPLLKTHNKSKSRQLTHNFTDKYIMYAKDKLFSTPKKPQTPDPYIMYKLCAPDSNCPR